MSIASIKSSRRGLVWLSALAASAITTSALAGEVGAHAVVMPTDVTSVTVRYGDLDLSSDAGSSVLYRRLTSAARQVCAADGTRDLNLLAAAQKCEDRAVAHAVQEINSTKLAMIYAARINHG